MKIKRRRISTCELVNKKVEKFKFNRNLADYKKKFYFKFSKKMTFTFFKFFLTSSTFQGFRLKITGQRFSPFFCYTNFWGNIVKKKKKDRIDKKLQQKKLDRPLNFNFKRSDAEAKSLEFFKTNHTKGYKIYIDSKNSFLKGFFEESADELKLFLEPNLIKFSINVNPDLGCSWLDKGYDIKKTKSFWSSYFLSCFNNMLKLQKPSRLVQFREILESSNFPKNSNKSDSEFFWLSTIMKKNLKMDLSELIFLYSFTFHEKKLISSESTKKKDLSICWRNRYVKNKISYKDISKYTNCSLEFTSYRVYLC